MIKFSNKNTWKLNLPFKCKEIWLGPKLRREGWFLGKWLKIILLNRGQVRCLVNLWGFFFLMMILTQEEIAPKKYNLYSPRRIHLSWKEEEISGNGLELKVSVDTGLKRLNVICSWEDGQRKRVPVIGINELGNVFIQVKRVGVLNRVFSRKRSFWRDYWFFLVRENADSIYKKGMGRRQF